MQSGTRLGPYEILRHLGRGGMGDVWAARDTRLDRIVAIKVLPPELTGQPERLARFENEAKTLAALDHPGIVTVHSIERARPEGGSESATGSSELRFITMQLVDGVTLDEVIPRQGCATEKFLQLAIPLADAVAAAHRQGITHRDLKPANVQVTGDGRVKVLDFGLAKATRVFGTADGGTEIATEMAPITEEGQVLGTVAYMSPEQAQAQGVDARSDVFSLGILLYQMATGHQPFTGDTKMSVLSSIIREQPQPVVRLNPELPRHLGRIIAKCLQKDPERRYQSAIGLRNDLETLAEEVRSGEVEPFAAAVGRERDPARRGPAPALVGALVVVIALAVAAWQLLGFGETTLVAGATTQLTRTPGLELYPAVSPDGEMVAYAAGPQAQMRLYVRGISGGRAVPLTQSFPGNHRGPRWSPDGERIAFMTDGGLWTVPALGGVPRQVPLTTVGAINGLDWSPDGARLAYSQGQALFTVPVSGGEPVELVNSGNSHSPAWSPDGRWIAYVEGNNTYGYMPNALGNIAGSSVRLIAAEGGDPIEITDMKALNTSPAWRPDSRELLYVSDRDGSRDVYRQPLESNGAPRGDPIRLTTALDAHTVSLSRDGSRLAYSEFRYGTNVWTLPIPSGESVSVSDAVPITRGDQIIEAMTVSPDGRWLAFDSNLGGNQDVYRVRLVGGEDEQLTTDPASDFVTSYSPDGSEIGFYSMRTGSRKLFTIPAAGGTPTQVTFGPGQHRYPTFSPDGLRIAYSVSDVVAPAVSGIAMVSRAGPGSPGENERMLTEDGGNRPRWSPDGSLIAYVIGGEGGTRLMILSPDGGEPRVVLRVDDRSLQPAPEFPAWSSDSRTLYYTAFDDVGRSSIWSIPVAGGEPALLVRFDDPDRWAGRREFATDGKSFFFTIGVRESDVWAMQLDTR